jgi:hypothetical protein
MRSGMIGEAVAPSGSSAKRWLRQAVSVAAAMIIKSSFFISVGFSFIA